MKEPEDDLQRLEHALRGVTLVMGASDTGKSALAARLASAAAQEGRKAALVDLDPGQSEVGPPGMLDVAEAETDAPVARWRVQGHWYLGATHPFAGIARVVSGARRLADRAREHGYDPVIVDTPSFVPTLEGLALVTALYDVIRPDRLVALQWRDEMERWLSGLGGPVTRSPVDPAVRSKPTGLRAVRRGARLGAYFRGAGEQNVRLTEIPLRGTRLGAGYPESPAECARASTLIGRTVVHAERTPSSVAFWTDGPPPHAPQRLAAEFGVPRAVSFDAGAWRNRSVGFIGANGFCMAMGLIREVNWAAMTARILVPLYSVADAAAMSLGLMRHTPDGEELPPVPERDA